MPLPHLDPQGTCECCGQTEGVCDGLIDGVAVDPITGLCLHCQPCPDCGEYGTSCWDDPFRGCVNPISPRRTA